MMKLTMVTMAPVCRLGRNQNSPIWRMNMTAKVVRRPIVSDIHAQKTRPNALPMLTTPTMPAATMAGGFLNSQSVGAEASDGNARHQSTTSGKPLHQDRDRNDVGKTESDAADDAVSQVEPPESVIRQAGEKNTETIQRPTGHCYDTRADTLQPQAAEERREAKHHNGNREGERDLRNGPIKPFGQRYPKDAPGIHRTKGHLQ